MPKELVKGEHFILPTGETQGDRPAPQITSEPAEESEHDMSSLTAGFAMWMHKRAASAQGETTPCSEVLGGKRPKRSGLNEEVQKSPVVITSNSPKRASDALLALEGATKDASKDACASLEDGTLARRPQSIDKVVGEGPFAETTVGQPLLARQSNLAILGPRKPRVLDRLVLNSPFKPMKWDYLSVDTSVPGLDAA